MTETGGRGAAEATSAAGPPAGAGGGDRAFDAVLFDLDGTLLDSLGDLASAMNAVLEAAGHATHPVDAYRHFVGEGMEMLVRRTLPAAARTEKQVAAALAAMRAEYGQRWADTTRPYAGVPDLLDALQGRGLPLAVLSNKPETFTVLAVERLLAPWSFAVVRGQRPDTPPKPDPAGALAVAAQLGVPPARIVYVGDTATDMETARAAGMAPVGVTWGFREGAELEAHGAWRLVRRPQDLLECL